jgi:hypothetical protein
VALQALPEGGALWCVLRRARTGRRGRTGAAAGRGQGRGQHDGAQHTGSGSAARQAVGQAGQQCVSLAGGGSARVAPARGGAGCPASCSQGSGSCDLVAPASEVSLRRPGASAAQAAIRPLRQRVQVLLSAPAARGRRTWKAAPLPARVSTVMSPAVAHRVEWAGGSAAERGWRWRRSRGAGHPPCRTGNCVAAPCRAGLLLGRSGRRGSAAAMTLVRSDTSGRASRRPVRTVPRGPLPGSRQRHGVTAAELAGRSRHRGWYESAAGHPGRPCAADS